MAGWIVHGTLPAPPPGVEELRFRDMYKMPVGDRGLEPSQRLLSLNGKRVRMIGYLVKMDDAPPGVVLLSPLPVSGPDLEDGPADDFPPQIVYVHLPDPFRERTAAWVHDLVAFEGTLEVGARDEAGSRVSNVRLIAELPPQRGKPAVVSRREP